LQQEWSELLGQPFPKNVLVERLGLGRLDTADDDAGSCGGLGLFGLTGIDCDIRQVVGVDGDAERVDRSVDSPVDGIPVQEATDAPCAEAAFASPPMHDAPLVGHLGRGLPGSAEPLKRVVNASDIDACAVVVNLHAIHAAHWAFAEPHADPFGVSVERVPDQFSDADRRMAAREAP